MLLGRNMTAAEMYKQCLPLIDEVISRVMQSAPEWKGSRKSLSMVGEFALKAAIRDEFDPEWADTFQGLATLRIRDAINAELFAKNDSCAAPSQDAWRDYALPTEKTKSAWDDYAGISSGKDNEDATVQRFMPLVRNIVDRLKSTLPATYDVDALYAVGVSGLREAFRKHDFEAPRSFASYAEIRIRGAILEELRRSAIAALDQKLRRQATDQELMRELGLSREECQMRAHSSAVASDGSKDIFNLIIGADSQIQPEMSYLLTKLISELPDIPRRILACYHFENMTLAETASALGLPEDRVTQIHVQTVIGLRAKMHR